MPQPEHLVDSVLVRPQRKVLVWPQRLGPAKATEYRVLLRQLIEGPKKATETGVFVKPWRWGPRKATEMGCKGH